MRWYYYLGILILLIFVVFTFINQERPTELGTLPVDHWSSGKSIIPQNLESSDYISLSKEEFETYLIKKMNKWFVKTPTGRMLPATEGRVKSLLNQLNDITVERVSSINPERHSDFMLEIEEAFNVIIKSDNNKILHFLIGKNNDSFTGTFVRHENDNTTLLTNVRLGANIINATTDFWINKEIIGDVDINNLTSIKLYYYEDDEKEFTIERDITTDSFYVSYLYNESDTRYELPKSRVKSIANTLKFLKGTDFAPENITMDEAFETINYKCEINFITSPSYTIVVGNRITDNDYFIKNPDNDYIYYISTDFIKRIFSL